MSKQSDQQGESKSKGRGYNPASLANLKPHPRWKKGESGNPKGAPLKLESEAERTRLFLDTEDPETGRTYGELIRMKKLELALGGNLGAIESLETRAYGKPADTVKLESRAAPPAGYLAILGIHGLHEPEPFDVTATQLPSGNSDE